MLLVGDTVIADVVEPSLQLYPVPPLAVSVVLVPLQMVVFPLIRGVGFTPMVTATEVEPVQPLLSVVVTV